MKIHEQITEKTWCQGKTKFDNHMCLFGWIQFIYCDKYYEIYQKVIDLVHEDTVPKWNDASKRKFSEVLELCKKLDI